MSVHLFYFVLILGVISVSPATGKIRSKIKSVFKSLEKFKNLLRNISIFIKIFHKKVLGCPEPVKHVIKKLKNVGPRMETGLQRLLDHIKPFKKLGVLKGFIEPVDKRLTLVVTVVTKINDFLSGDMTVEDKDELNKEVSPLCCVRNCPCKPFEESEPALSFIKNMKELAEKLTERKHSYDEIR